MTVEELLKPRYKVIADYPKSIHAVGTVYTIRSNMQDLLYCDHDGPRMRNYPHLFRLLEWWEERKEDEVPDYVKYNGNVYKVADKSQNGRIHHKPNEIEHRFIWPKAKGYLPATKEEFEAQ